MNFTTYSPEAEQFGRRMKHGNKFGPYYGMPTNAEVMR